MHVAHQKHAARQPRQQPIDLGPAGAGGSVRALEAVQNARLVAIGLQAAQKPRADVRQAFVVEIHGVLRGQHDAKPHRAALFEQREERHLGRRIRHGREEAEDLIHVEHGPQAARAALRAHPAGDRVQQHRHEEHPLPIVKVRDREDRHARLPCGRSEERGNVERVALGPHLEAGRGQQRVEGQRKGETILRRKERIDVDDPDSGHRRLLDGLHQSREVRALAGVPRGLKHGGQQDMLAALHRLGVNARQRKQARHRRLHTLADDLGIVGRGPGERSEHGHWAARGAARRVDREIGRLAQPRNTGAVLSPVAQPLFPARRLVGCEVRARLPRPLGFLAVDPGLEIRARERREGQEQVGEVTFRVDDDGGYAVDRGFFDESDAEAGLAAARHADDQGVRDQVPRVVEDRLRFNAWRGGAGPTPKIEHTKLLEVSHTAIIGGLNPLEPERSKEVRT